MIDLKPCPFCGGEAETTLGPIPGKWGARCKECDVWRDDREATEAEAIAAWNARTVDPAAIRKEALREAVRVHHQGVGAILALIDKGAG